jgi:hypothetical protein
MLHASTLILREEPCKQTIPPQAGKTTALQHRSRLLRRARNGIDRVTGPEQNEDQGKWLYVLTPDALRRRIVSFANGGATTVTDHVKFSVRTPAIATQLLFAVGNAFGLANALASARVLAALDAQLTDTDATHSDLIKQIKEDVACSKCLLPRFVLALQNSGIKVSVRRAARTQDAHVDVYLSLDRRQASILATAFKDYKLRLQTEISSMNPALTEHEIHRLLNDLATYEQLVRRAGHARNPEVVAERIKQRLADYLVLALELVLSARGLLGTLDRQAMIDGRALSRHLSGHVSGKGKARLRKSADIWVDAIIRCDDLEPARESCVAQIRSVYEEEIKQRIAGERTEGRAW